MNNLKVSDPVRQERLETIIRQLGFTATGRAVSERDNVPPMLTYWLSGEGDLRELLELLPGQGYGLAREVDTRQRGRRVTHTVIVRQLVPTQYTAPSAIKEFGV